MHRPKFRLQKVDGMYPSFINVSSPEIMVIGASVTERLEAMSDAAGKKQSWRRRNWSNVIKYPRVNAFRHEFLNEIRRAAVNAQL